ncbi:BON domain-containing protein [Pseudomarimonas salicorniae]|uniref:BON domain-containing protein n=1 Tax=Pseudomarimonas salicorniae TaxID=2933270 RepID=A0ABT0GD62_9GAMM|nr:BON domain-containing protein [Lysobacter sp. CAU 1642]MCK7592475.1 BON domain-containing protein [Lysobacter sp. CAU 1642]
MPTTLKSALTPLALACGLAASAGVHAGPLAEMSAEAKDAYREGLIWATYATSESLDSFALDVEVEGNTATLEGEVESVIERRLAERIALGTEGIDKVVNRIRVEPDLVIVAATLAPQRSFARMVGDAAITAKIDSLLLWNEYTDGLDINVETVDGKVTLTGVADTRNSRKMADRLARAVAGVREVDNRLSIDENAEGQVAVADDGDGVMSDSWISAKVRSTLRYAGDISDYDIHVEAEDGTVMLSGQVDSDRERRLAIELAQGVRGVQSVDARGLTAS